MFAIALSLSLNPILGFGGAGRYAPFPAPFGFHWEFVTENSITVTENSIPVVALVGNT